MPDPCLPPLRQGPLVPILALLLLAAGVSAPARAQFVLRDHEDLAFDRPEAWAMAWFAAVTFPTTLAPPAVLEPGALEVSLEGGWVPTLSTEQRTVGFLGEKPEDLNRTSVFARPRLAVGLPGELTLTAGWAPPVTVNGVEPNLVSLAVGRPLWHGRQSTLAARLLGERGRLRGDLTCPADVAALGASPGNPYGCEAPSRDTMRLRLLGVELQAGTTLTRWPRLAPYAAVAASRLHAELQVDAQRGFLDRTLLETDGTLWSGTLGLAIDSGGPLRLAAELFYTPLEVKGRAGHGRQSDGLLNARLLAAYRLR